MSKLNVFLLCAFFVLSAGKLFAQTTHTWIGGSGDWNEPANWTPAGVPGSPDTAIINSGTVTLTTDVTVAGLELSGTLDGDFDFLVTSLMNWNGGVVQGSGTLNITASATLRLSGTNQQTLRRNLENNGATIWEAGQFAFVDGVTFNNNSSFLDQHSSTQSLSGVYAGGTFNNYGAYIKRGAGQTNISLPFNNLPGGDIRGTGTMKISSVFTNEGSVSPGDSLGTLILTTNYPTTPTSELNIEIGGIMVDSLYDRLNISGQASLDGTLNISLINNFIPAIGDTFVVMIFSSQTGNFSKINGLNTGSGVSFEVDLSSTALKLITIATPNSTPSIFSLYRSVIDLRI